MAADLPQITRLAAYGVIRRDDRIPMRVTGGDERVEVDGSTDAFDWVPLDAVDRLPLGDLVPRVLEVIGRDAAGT